MAGISSLTYKATVGSSVQAQNNVTPTAGGAITSNAYPTKTLSIGTSAANNAAGGGDQAFLFIVTAAASGSATVDWTSVANVLGATGVTLARIKHVRAQLLSTADDAVNGTNCTSATVWNNGVNDWISQSHTGWLASATSVLDVPNGGWVEFGTPSAGGVVVDGTHKLTKVTNNDGANAMAAQFTGAGGST